MSAKEWAIYVPLIASGIIAWFRYSDKITLKTKNILRTGVVIGTIISCLVLFNLGEQTKQEKGKLNDTIQSYKKQILDTLTANENNRKRTSIELKIKSDSIINLNRKLLSTTNKFNDYLTGAEGYPVVIVNRFSNGGFVFELRNFHKYPVYGVTVHLYSYSCLKKLLDENNDNVPFDNYVDNCKTYEWVNLDQLSPVGGLNSAYVQNVSEGLYFVQIVSLGKFNIERLAVIQSGTKLLYGFIITDLDGKVIQHSYSADTPHEFKSKINAALNSIDLRNGELIH